MPTLDDTPLFQPRDTAEWGRWLAANHASFPRIWLVFVRKAGGEAAIGYDEAVEEALCWGWVDSLTKKLDDGRFKMLFTPRKPGSAWARSNKERVARLVASGRMQPAGLAKVTTAQADGSWNAMDAAERLEEPDDLVAALDGTPEARPRWNAFSASSRKGILYWIQTAKTPATRERRIAETARLAALGLRVQHPESKGR